MNPLIRGSKQLLRARVSQLLAAGQPSIPRAGLHGLSLPFTSKFRGSKLRALPPPLLRLVRIHPQYGTLNLQKGPMGVRGMCYVLLPPGQKPPEEIKPPFVHTPRFESLAHRLINDFQTVGITMTETGPEIIHKLYGDIPDVSLNENMVGMLRRRLEKYMDEDLQKNPIRQWVQEWEGEQHVNTLHRARGLHYSENKWEAFEEMSEYWGSTVYYFLRALMKGGVLRKP